MATCTATFLGEAVTVSNNQFSSVSRSAGISISSTVSGTFLSSTTVSGTFAGYYGSYTIACGGISATGYGDILFDGTFDASRVSTCGNGIVEAGEECDSTNQCDVDCQRVPICGDHFVDYPETCDDGNATGGDGCSATCSKEVRPLSYPSGLPATGQSIAGSDYVIYQISGLTAGTAYRVSTTSNSDIDIYVFGDTGKTQQLCISQSYSGDESCSATPTGGSLTIEVDNHDTASATFTIDVTPPISPDAGVAGSGGSSGTAGSGGSSASGGVTGSAGSGGSSSAGGIAGSSASGGTSAVGGAAGGSTSSPPPAVLVSPPTLDFGERSVNATSNGATLHVSNSNGVTGTPSVELVDTVNFGILANECTTGVAAGSPCSVAVVFHPKTKGVHTTNLTISASPGGTQTVPLSGIGGSQLEISPTTQDYFSVSVGESHPAAYFIVSNGAYSALGPLSVQLVGGDCANFTISSDPCTGATLTGSLACTLGVLFAPTSMGIKTCTVFVSAGTESASATLTGTGS